MHVSTHVNMQYSHCMTPGMVSRESNKILSQLLGADQDFTIFTSVGGYGRGRAPPVTARGFGGALLALPVVSTQQLLPRIVLFECFILERVN